MDPNGNNSLLEPGAIVQVLDEKDGIYYKAIVKKIVEKTATLSYTEMKYGEIRSKGQY